MYCSGRCKRGHTGPTNAQRAAAAAAEFAPGAKFNALLVLRYEGGGQVAVRCDCGHEKVVGGSDLRSGATGSCGRAGCASLRRGRPVVHGGSGTPEYQAWAAIKQRIFNPNCHAFEHYGGRGLTMEADWVDDFGAFLAEVGPRPSADLTLDRINNDLGYVRGNLRWASWSVQNSNKHRAA